MDIGFLLRVGLTQEEVDHIASVRDEEHINSRASCTICSPAAFTLLDAVIPQLRHRLGLPPTKKAEGQLAAARESRKKQRTEEPNS